MSQSRFMSAPHLRRALGLWNLVFYGIIMVQPTAPMPVFGVVSEQARGHVVSAVLVAMCAMLLTALSYGRMASVHPAAGSAFTYVTEEIHPHAGFLTGWSILLDYLVGPVICIIWCSKAAGNILPAIPYAGWIVFFAVLFTGMNLVGIRTSARTSEIMVLIMCAAIAAFFVAAIRYLMHQPVIHPLQPFYDPATFSLRGFATGTSIAILTYIGFDEVSTLAEEARDPRRDILRATVLTCLLTGVFATLQVYVGQLVWPENGKFPDVDTAFVYVAGRAGGQWLFHTINVTLLLANVGSGMGAQLAAARLLYGMGRDGALPGRFFAQLHPTRAVPTNNVWLTGAIALIASFLLSYQVGAELLNFGAFIAFIGVNIAAFRYGLRRKKGWLAPIVGAVVCFTIWIGLRPPILIAGAAWLAAGFAFRYFRTRVQ